MYGDTLFKGTMFQAISATAEYVQACLSHMCAHSSSSHTSHTGGYGHARLAHMCAHTLPVTYLAISSTVAFLVRTRTTSSISMCCSFFHCDTHHETDFNLQIADNIRQPYRIGPLTFADRYGHVSNVVQESGRRRMGPVKGGRCSETDKSKLFPDPGDARSIKIMAIYHWPGRGSLLLGRVGSQCLQRLHRTDHVLPHVHWKRSLTVHMWEGILPPRRLRAHLLTMHRFSM